MTNRLRGVAVAGACALAVVLTGCGSSAAPAQNASSGNAGQDMSQMSPEDMANMPGMQGATPDNGTVPGMGDNMGGMDMGGDPGAVELWAVQSGPLGVVVTDGGGRIVYQSDKDSTAPPASTCVDDCLKTWQPMLMNDKPVSGLGVDESKIGYVLRPDGSKQITLFNHPLYLHVGENGGLANAGANGADGVWWAINPAGAKADPVPATAG
jgi:predicted lipoprotein with Yx(FWY)xxD motif